jgi:hypothetical protein
MPVRQRADDRAMKLSPTLTGAVFSLAMLVSLPAGSALAAGSRPVPLAETGTWCLAPNTTCIDGPWWQAQPEPSAARSAPLATFAGLDGLRADPAFAEAVRLLWQWPEGRKELIGAARHGVQIRQGPRHPHGDSDSFATYDDDTLTVEVAYEDLDVPTWMLADLLAHELRHANDMSQLPGGWEGSQGCFELEQRAYSTEQRYMAWLDSRFGGLPSPTAEYDAGLSYAADDLYTNMLEIGQAEDIVGLVHHDYADTCTDD